MDTTVHGPTWADGAAFEVNAAAHGAAWGDSPEFVADCSVHGVAWGDSAGLVVDCCYLAESPLAEATVPDEGDGSRVRYLAFRADQASAGRNQAIRVMFADLPVGFEYAEGRTMWIGQPREVCENAGQSTPPVGGCGPAPGLPDPTFWVATLQCDPHFADWSVYEGVHVYDGSIVPDGVYDIQMIDASCDLLAQADYSEPLAVKTSRWGDAVKDCTTTPCGPPDGSAAIVDVTAALDKFKNLSGAPAKSRCDLEPNVPDLLINITDVTSALEAFKGIPYPFPGPAAVDPCP